jgi:general secretion pathway protein K
MSKNRFDELKESRGVILIIVLWTVAMMTVVIAALSTNVRTSANLAGTETRRLKTETLLEGGIDVAAAALIASGDNLRALADGHATNIELGNANLAEMKIRDASGFVDINRAEEDFLEGLIAHVTGSPEIGKTTAQLIIQWRSSETETAEDTEPPAFASVAQLYDIKNIDRKVVTRILPFVNLYSKEGLVSLAAAPEEVIASIPEVNPVQVETLLGARSRGDLESNDINDLVDDFGDYITVDPSNVFVVDLTLVRGPGLIPGTHLAATIMINKTGDIPFHVLSRSW